MHGLEGKVIVMHSRPRAVVVDDDSFYRRIVSTCLDSLGWDTATMASGHDILRWSIGAGEPFHVAIIDADMPMLSGTETAQSLALTRPEMDIIVMDAPEDCPFDERWLYLAKPIDFSLLINHMRMLRQRLEASEAKAA